MSETRPCRACGKKITLLRNDDGKIVPLDMVAPVFAIETDLLGNPVAKRVNAYVSHFATCPSANDFGKGKKK